MSGCASFVNWGKRINVTLGGGLPLNDVDVSVEGIENISDTVTIRDVFGDYYTTSWKFEKKDPLNIPVAASVSIPCYWKDFNKIGIETGILMKTCLPQAASVSIFKAPKENSMLMYPPAYQCRETLTTKYLQNRRGTLITATPACI
ncbi:MAG: hypothetical protein MdMp014T_0048 [Treponematales bacterium]